MSKNTKTSRSRSVSESHKREYEYNGDYYSYDDVFSFCKNINGKYLKSGGQRTLIKENKKMFHSILKYSDEISQCKGVSFRARVYFILGKIKKYKCDICGRYYHWCNCEFKMYMCNKDPHYKYDRSLNHYIEQFGYENGKKKFDKIRTTIKRIGQIHKDKKINSLQYYINKFGVEFGKKKFEDFLNSHPKFAGHYSKISQTFFQELIKECAIEKDKCYFATNNGEKIITLSNDETKLLNQTFIKVDFCINNKIIEYNGEYWHRNTKEIDNIRINILKAKGYDVLTVWENNDFNLELKKAKEFLNKDRFNIQISNLTYSKFDGISKTSAETITIVFSNFNIKVSKHHRFVVNNNTVYAKDLKLGDCLQNSNNEYVKIINIYDSGISDVYDILETSDHTYIANDIINHNCEFLGSSDTLLDAGTLRELIIKDPIRIQDQILNIYTEPKEKHKYILAVDPAKDGKDAFAIQIVDVTTINFKQVASANVQIDYFKMIEYVYNYGMMYNTALIVIENNEGAGQSIADFLKNDYEYENLYYDKARVRDSITIKNKKQAGFRTTTRTRKLILNNLKLFCESGKFNIVDKKTINELFTFININGKYQADSDCHDDSVMALALVFAPFTEARNFIDIKKMLELLESEESEESTIDIEELINMGNFDDFTDDSIDIGSNAFI